MGGRGLYLRVGLLVVAGIVLAVGFVLFLAGRQGSGASAVYETYSRESVQGLDVGAPVRYRGVPIGRVTEIGLVSAQYRRPEGTMYGEAFQLVVVRFAVDIIQVGEVPELDEAIRLGLRARIAAQGITGVNYVELDFVNPDRFPVPRIPWTPRYPVIPAVPSTVAQVTTAAEQIVERLSRVPLEEMVTDLAGLLSALNTQAVEGDVATTLREAARSMTLLRQVLEAGDLQATLAELRQAAAAARGTLAAPELRAAVNNAAGAAAELRRASQRLPGAVDSFERTLRSTRETTTDVQAELIPILQDLRATTASLRATAEALRASPSQALFGAPPPPPERRR